MRPAAWRALLVAHVGTSVGWLGAVAASLALAVVALVTADGEVADAVFLVLEPLGWAALVPFSVASLSIGVIQSLLSPWGLLRHYWVIVKLVMNLLAVAVLLLYMQTLAQLAHVARAGTAGGDPGTRSLSPVIHAAAAIVLLLVALTLSVYKPRGQAGWGYGMRASPTEPGTV